MEELGFEVEGMSTLNSPSTLPLLWTLATSTLTLTSHEEEVVEMHAEGKSFKLFGQVNTGGFEEEPGKRSFSRHDETLAPTSPNTGMKLPSSTFFFKSAKIESLRIRRS